MGHSKFANNHLSKVRTKAGGIHRGVPTAPGSFKKKKEKKKEKKKKRKKSEKGEKRIWKKVICVSGLHRQLYNI